MIVLDAGFADTYYFRFLFRPLGYITNVWAEVLLVLLGWLCLARRYSVLFIFLCVLAILFSFSRGAYISLGIYLLAGLLWKPYHANQDLIVWLRQEAKKPSYHHLLYDKYRKVFYRFACMPYEYPADRNPMEEDTGREFSIIILNDKYEIIGETRFPGNTYAYRLWFIGRDGLYLSLNNQGNPNFDEDRLLFRRLKLEYKR